MKGHVSKLMDAWINEWMNEVIHDWEKNELRNKKITKGIKDGKMERWIDDRVSEYIKKKGRKKALCKRRRPVNKKQHTSVTFNAKQ